MPGKPQLPGGLYPIVDPLGRPDRTHVLLAEALIAAGVSLLQVRAKSASARELLELSRAVIELARPAGVMVIVNDRPDVARIAGADGVHLGQTDLPPAYARRVIGEEMLLGWSTHNTEQVREAREWPVDYLGYGPVFGTQSKENPDPTVGLGGLARAAASSRVPVVGIGGITGQNIGEVARAGAHGAAVIGALTDALDVPRAARELQEAWAAT